MLSLRIHRNDLRAGLAVADSRRGRDLRRPRLLPMGKPMPEPLCTYLLPDLRWAGMLCEN